MSCLYILKINSMSVTSFANTFFPFCRLSVCFVCGFLCCASFYVKLGSICLFLFHFHYSRSWIQKNVVRLSKWLSETVVPMLSSRIFIIYGLTFRSLRKFSNFILLYVAVIFIAVIYIIFIYIYIIYIVIIFQHHLLKRLLFLHFLFSPLYHRLIEHRFMD